MDKITCDSCVFLKTLEIKRGEYEGKLRDRCELKSIWIDDVNTAENCDSFDDDSWVK